MGTAVIGALGGAATTGAIAAIRAGRHPPVAPTAPPGDNLTATRSPTPDGGAGMPGWPAWASVSAAVAEEVTAQRQRIATIDQRAGYLLSAAAVLVGLTAPQPQAIGHRVAAASGGFAVLAVLAALVAIFPITGTTIDPRRVLERYRGAEDVLARQQILVTQVTVYERDERTLRVKGLAARAAAMLLAAAVVTVVVGLLE